MAVQGRSKLFQGGAAEVYIPQVVSRGVWEHAPPGIISILATLCEVVIAHCARNLVHVVATYIRHAPAPTNLLGDRFLAVSSASRFLIHII